MKKLVISLLSVMTIMAVTFNVTTPKDLHQPITKFMKMQADGDTG
ncbi:hypothetical protein P4409_00120 [Bacillus thuringiensis]|nr:hypothetical protein [Bacillus thuringiensis]